jgi:hypothetical protein
LAPEQATSGTMLSEPQTFRSVTALIVFWVVILFVVANLIDLAVQGRDHMSLVAAGILVMGAGVAYVAGWRPRVIAAADGITIKNPVRDHHIPWLDVEKADLADQLRVHTRASGTEPARKISAWSVHYSRRKAFASDAKARRAAAKGDRPQRFSIGGSNPFGIQQSPAGRTATDPVSDEAQAERVVNLLNAQAEVARAEGTAGTAAGAVTSTWARDAIAALVIPAIILLICCLA